MTTIKIPKQKLSSLFTNGKKSAEAVKLVYVSDNEPGISRVKKNDTFIYILNGKQVKTQEILQRIKKLVLPPAWERVWICADANGHLQATGYDLRNRKQYKYHSLWTELRSHTKFHHLYEFGKVLPAIRERLEKDMNKPGLPVEKVLATIVSVMQETAIRIGNSQCEKLYGSFGLTTLKDKHVSFQGSSVQFSFVGKKGVHHSIGLKSRRLARIVKQCRDIPGKELFQYYDESGHRHAVDSGMVNAYIKEISGGAFTAKDFRTWTGTLLAIEAFQEVGSCNTQTQTQKNIVKVLDLVAKHLGNTRNVCKKYYVHPSITELYSTGTLEKHLSIEEVTGDHDNLFSISERRLMKILGTCSAPVIAA